MFGNQMDFAKSSRQVSMLVTWFGSEESGGDGRGHDVVSLTGAAICVPGTLNIPALVLRLLVRWVLEERWKIGGR